MAKVINEIYNTTETHGSPQLMCGDEACEENPPWRFDEGKAAKYGLSTGVDFITSDCSCYLAEDFVECPCGALSGVTLCTE